MITDEKFEIAYLVLFWHAGHPKESTPFSCEQEMDSRQDDIYREKPDNLKFYAFLLAIWALFQDLLFTMSF